jgi:3-oxoacid CoA-transferase subunit B
MDLVAGAKKVIVAMQAADKQGQSKLRKKCTLPLTGVNCVHSIVSDWGVFEIKDSAFILKEYPPDLSPEWIQKNTEGRVILDAACRVMNLNGN